MVGAAENDLAVPHCKIVCHICCYCRSADVFIILFFLLCLRKDGLGELDSDGVFFRHPVHSLIPRVHEPRPVLFGT